MKDLFQSEQLSSRNMLIPLENDPSLRIAGNPIKFSGTPDTLVAGKTPGLGEHSEEILGTVLGYSKEEISALCRE